MSGVGLVGCGEGVPAYIGTDPERASVLNMTVFMDHLDARERAAQRRAQALIRRWALGLFTAIAVPVALQYMWLDKGISIPMLPETRWTSIEMRMDRHTAETRRLIEGLAWVVYETQDLVVDSTHHIGAKLDSVHKRARKVAWSTGKGTAERATSVNARVARLFEGTSNRGVFVAP